MKFVEQIDMYQDTRSNDSASGEVTVTLHGVFEKQAVKTPNRIAIKFDHQQLTYRELNDKAEQLALRLLDAEVRKDDVVAICLDRSFETIIAILAVAKAGAAYLAIDAAYPDSRIQFMLGDTNARLLLTKSSLAGQLAAYDLPRLELDKEWPLTERSPADLPDVFATDLAYVIYTSGSTGQPKGVMIEHGGICNAIQAHLDQLAVSEKTRFLQFASLSFDASLIEIFTPLWLGGMVVLASQEILLDEQRLAALVAAEEISAAILPPSMLKIIEVESLKSVKVLLSVGEVCSPELATRWYEGRDFYNGYGPSENSVCTTLFVVRDTYLESVPIGKPIGNCLIHLRDAQQNEVATGEVGEIYISGIGLARGYLNQPQLTNERFIIDPLDRAGKRRLYRTGDLARQLPDGNYTFVGRVDHQIKIRGQRVELEEIERAVQSHLQVSDAAVVVQKDGLDADLLICYYVAEGDNGMKQNDFRDFLRRSLPEYMLPGRFVMLDKLPLTTNGKIDRKALMQRPLIERANGHTAESASGTESWLRTILADILGQNDIATSDSVFDIGANSLHLTQLVSRIRSQYAIDCSLNLIFKNPEIRSLAAAIDKESGSTETRQEIRPVLPVIKRVSREQLRLKR